MSAGYEQSDVDPRVPLRIGVAMIIFLVLGIAAVTGIMFTLWAVDDTSPSPFGPGQPESTGPQVQPDPRADMQALTRSWDHQLAGTGWVDREAGLVRIPIEDAMLQTVRAGWRDGPQADAP